MQGRNNSWLFHLSIFKTISLSLLFIVLCEGIKYHVNHGVIAGAGDQRLSEQSVKSTLKPKQKWFNLTKQSKNTVSWNRSPAATPLPFSSKKSLSVANSRSKMKTKSALTSKYHVQTPACTIPVTKILPDYYRKLYYEEGTPLKRKRQNIPDCRNNTKFAYLIQNNKVLKLDPNFTRNKNCTLYEIKRMENHDKSYTSIVHPLKNSNVKINVTEMEMFMTRCDEQSNYDARILLKPAVKQKIKFWDKELKRLKKLEKLEKMRKETSRSKSAAIPTPINVLLLGFDSISRSHFHRSVPKSLRRLNKLNFTDFRGFHSISPHTLFNLERLLFGTARKCSANIPYFDPCLFIWKDFNAMNYVTMYNEDYEGSFNTGLNQGFKFKQPTDFYLRPLFNAILKLRGTQSFDCVSSETVPHFLLRYLAEFLHVFKNTPFFSFTYFNNPFHDKPQAMADFDDDLEMFIEKSLTKEILEKTLIIITADHGERYGMFHEHSLESYLERSLPPLFIRVPENLKKKYPDTDFDANLRHNARRLTTALDIHHTLLHTIILSAAETRIHPGKTKATPSSPVSLAWIKQADVARSNLLNFSASLPDRSSLFLPLFSNRSCITLDIDDDGTCVCNSTGVDDYKFLDDAPVQEPRKAINPFLVQNLIIFAVDELNKEIKRGEGEQWSGSCADWRLNILPQISALVIASGTGRGTGNETGTRKTGKNKPPSMYQDILLKFRASTVRSRFGIDGKFQVKLRLYKDKKGKKNKGARNEKENSPFMKRMERLSVFSRLDEYKDQSWCIRPIKTKEEKQMKEMCVCKLDKAEYYDDGYDGWSWL